MKSLLLDAKKQVEKAQEQGKTKLATKKIEAIKKQYEAIVEAGIKSIPIPKLYFKRYK